MAKEAYKRRNYLINKRFQFKYTTLITATLFVVMLVSGAGLYLGMWGSIIENFSQFKVSQNLENIKRITDYEDARYKKGDYRLERIFREAELLSATEKETLVKALGSVNRSLVPKILVLIFLVSLGGIFLSHKIAGPMYRIEKSAEAIRNGDLRVKFTTRKSDELKEATSILEDMVKSLNKDIQMMKAASAVMKNIAEGLKGHIPERDGERLQQAIKELDSILSKYKT